MKQGELDSDGFLLRPAFNSLQGQSAVGGLVQSDFVRNDELRFEAFSLDAHKEFSAHRGHIAHELGIIALPHGHHFLSVFAAKLRVKSNLKGCGNAMCFNHNNYF